VRAAGGQGGTRVTATCQIGGSQKTAMPRVSRSTSGTTLHTGTATDASGGCSPDLGRRSFFDPKLEAPSSSGGSLPTIASTSEPASGKQASDCAAFRNEQALRSSDLVRQADAIADCLWPDRRHYTYVDPKGIRSGLPGACFLAAGWRYVRIRGHRARTKSGLLILERV
jgi:hypothetical protein